MELTADLMQNAEAEYSARRTQVRGIRERVAADEPLSAAEQDLTEKRKRMIAATSVEPVDLAFERYLGRNDLLPINYLTIGLLQSRAVGRIRFVDQHVGREVLATGFLISPDLMITNHHVFFATAAKPQPVAPDEQPTLALFDRFVKDASVEFNYERDIDGRLLMPLQFALDPHRFLYANKDLDMAIVAVQPTDNRGASALKDQGYVVLNKELGKTDIGDFASIIQHPSGQEKQIAIRENQITDMDDDRLFYKSDTAQGSSGAPVFNDQWQVIALHSAGVAKKDDRGRYVDKDGNVIEDEHGRVDESQVVWLSNQGFRISTIMNHLEQAADLKSEPLIAALFSPSYADSVAAVPLSRPTFDDHQVTAPTAQTPATVASPTLQPITISITLGGAAPVVTTSTGLASVTPVISAALETERYEDDLDFSGCTGFDEQFMGVPIPMPVPKAKLRKKLAGLIDSPGAYTLKYDHFSTLHHAVRRVPVVSAINVNGKLRYAALGQGTRVDKWYRDNRIDKDVQLNDDFYTRSGFDKGHLSRREDAEWGTTMNKAKIAADLTCSYANAVPQVPALNRAVFGYHGDWGTLEMDLLEKGVELEAGKAGRICVFNGPLFADDDPVFKGVQVALDFYKIVVWFDETGELRTTCYRLNQEKLVGQIDFEALTFDDVFRDEQVPIGSIEKITGLTFPAVVTDCDTYVKNP
jgi:endonuclease G, mitochondrial